MELKAINLKRETELQEERLSLMKAHTENS